LRHTEVSCPSSPAPPKVSSVPGTTGSVLVRVNAGVACRQLRFEWGDRDVRVSPKAATGSHPPEMNGAATLKTCWGVSTISNALGILDPPFISSLANRRTYH